MASNVAVSNTPRFQITENFCSKKVNRWEGKLVAKLNGINGKKKLIAFSIPYILGKAVLAVAKVAAYLFDALINFFRKLHKPGTQTRAKIALEFPEQLVRKVGSSVKQALIALVLPLRVAIDICDNFQRLNKKPIVKTV